MKSKVLFGISYVSIWVLIWGTIGSFIDFPLLKNGVYEANSIGQLSTFVLTAFISIILAVISHGKSIKIVLGSTDE